MDTDGRPRERSRIPALVVRGSARSAIVCLLIFVVFLLISAVQTMDEDPRERRSGWVGVLVFGAGAAVALWVIRGSRAEPPVLVLDAEGIQAPDTLTSPIPWEEVERVEMVPARRGRWRRRVWFVSVWARDLAKYLPPEDEDEDTDLHPLYGIEGATPEGPLSPISFCCRDVNRSAKAVMAWVGRYHPELVAGSGGKAKG